ncbi:hypothetical protein [Paenimyroides marinum]|uniref:hypothetical protein n=1 Tax=Paenimyroides marinum TaxID=1159016 RepID=UPI00115F7EC6|nr:hypothetical protein [Paenimyroides aquimaris]
MHHYTIPFPAFFQTGCQIMRGIFFIPKIGFGKIDFFSFHICDQRKEAKERRLFGTDILYY